MDLADIPLEVEEQFNFSSNSSYCLDQADCGEADGVSMPSFVLILTAIIYSLIFCAGITGNTLVIYCVLRFPSLHTVTNTYILNLALADECFLLGEPTPQTLLPPALTLFWLPQVFLSWWPRWSCRTGCLVTGPAPSTWSPPPSTR